MIYLEQNKMITSHDTHSSLIPNIQSNIPIFSSFPSLGPSARFTVPVVFQQTETTFATLWLLPFFPPTGRIEHLLRGIGLFYAKEIKLR